MNFRHKETAAKHERVHIEKYGHEIFNDKSKMPHFCCSKEFLGEEAFKIHQKFHENNQKYNLEAKVGNKKNYLYVCSICNKTFDKGGNFRRHQLIHTNERQFPCSYCTKTFKHIHDAKRHEVIIHKVKGLEKTRDKSKMPQESFGKPQSIYKTNLVFDQRISHYMFCITNC